MAALGKGGGTLLVAQREVDVAGVALPLVELGHEGEAVILLRGDLLGAGLEEGVLVGLGEGLGVPEGDLVLAVVALPLGRLDEHPGPRHPESDPAKERLDPAGAEQRVVDVVEVGRREAPVGVVPGFLVRLLEDDELELGGGIRPISPLPETVELAPQHLAGGGGDLDALRRETSARQRAVCSCHGIRRRVERSGRRTKSP